MLASLNEEQERLYDELLGRIQETDISSPYFDSPYWYYYRTEKGKAYPIYCRKYETLENPEEIFLDLNRLAEGKEYIDVASWSISDDHRYVAYSIDETGREVYSIHIQDLQTGVLIHEIPNTTGSLCWSGEHWLVYSVADETLRPHQIYRYHFEAGSTLLYQEEDDQFRVYFYRSASLKYIFLLSSSKLTTEAHYVDAYGTSEEPTLFSKRHPKMKYWPDHEEDRFLIRSNDCDDEEGNHIDARKNNQISSALISQTDRSHWTEEIAHRHDVQLTGIELFSSFWVLFERENGLEYIRIIDKKRSDDYRIPMPEEAFTTWGSINPDFEARAFRFGYSSLVSPESIYVFELDTQDLILQKEYPVLGYNRNQYISERLMIPSHDGTRVPISLVYRKDIDTTQPQPLFLTAYGAYGTTIDPYFSSVRLSLLDRGVVYVLAHPRGGGALGRQWYEDGKFLKKKNTFLDFIAVSEHLIEKGYTKSDRLIISGGSAGGLLIGAVLNMRPELYFAAIADVPFVDVVTTMLDDSIPLTSDEWEEWGDPRERVFFDYMLSYSPYDNIQRQDYPHLLVISGLNDPRVQYWEPTKWVARLRDRKTDENDLILKTHMGAGHMGQSGRYGYLKDIAFEYTFILEKWRQAGFLALF
ncbi:MAG: S9 family peptidase, partial [Myxococcota bacterium]|nr:S9 family peptidase [Myxococcota bacterium]